MNINYSIIIPYKNCPELLKRCLNSIPNRDDVQVIVIDDNSDNDKKPLVDRVDVEVVTLDANQSKGAGRARNVGLTHAIGKWLLFSDADDYFTESLSVLLDKYAADETTDMVFLNARMFNENDETLPFRLNELIDNYIKGNKNAELTLRYTFWTPWSRMVKRRIAFDNNILFDETQARNDKNFILECSSKAISIKVEQDRIYSYFRPSYGSITDKKRTVALIDDMIKMTSRTNRIYKNAKIKLRYSYLEIFRDAGFVAGMSRMDVIKKYLFCLKNNNVSILADVICFVKNRKMPNGYF